MTRLEKGLILARAASRLSPVMALYMMRRLIRNKLAVKMPSYYLSRLAKVRDQTPELQPTKKISPGLKEIADFYCAEYGDQIDNILEGSARLHGREIDFGAPGAIDWKREVPEEGNHQMWRVKLGHMGFFCPMLINGGSAHHRAVAEMIRSFRQTTSVTDPGAFNAYWFPYGASHRILALTSGFLVARARGDLPKDIEMEIISFLQENVAFLLDNVEHELCNNHVERNLAALCLYFNHVETVPADISARLEREIAHLIDKTILADGSQIERSPMYQGLSIASLAVLAETPYLSDQLKQKLHQKHQLARNAFAILCHPDGKVALFNDSWHHEVPDWTGEPAPDGRSLLPDGGYARLSQQQDMCLLDAGAIGPAWNPAHGHADFLATEITLSGQRLIVDPGTSRYNTGPVRSRERSTAAHNGPVWKDHEPVSFLGCFKVGRMAEANLLPIEDLLPDTIGGYLKSGPGTVGRIVRHYPRQGFLVADIWSSTETEGRVNWLIPRHWMMSDVAEKLELRHQNKSTKAVFEVHISDGAPDISTSYWACNYGQQDVAHEVRLKALKRGVSQVMLCWVGHEKAHPVIRKDGEEMLSTLARALKNK